ncbi:MAG: hypothetical protein NVSMB62_12070 [Acidobacteriaceae bacterium]
MHSHDPQRDVPNPSAISALLRRLFPLYCLLSALATFGFARYATFNVDGDGIAYMDIADCLRAHRWAGAVNGYWHPMYPAFLAAGHRLFHATLRDEAHAYFLVNFILCLLGIAAVTLLADSLSDLRDALEPAVKPPGFLLDRYALRYIGIAVLLFATQREFSLGIMRPDLLLGVFLLCAVAALLRYFTTGRTVYPALMGLALGCGFLTKSFAFAFTCACLAVLVLCGLLWRRRPASLLLASATALACFALVAGPYIAALSHQKGRLDFGDSGALNYAWYVSHTSRVHLEPYMTSQFGSATVNLKHPQPELLRDPQVLSYAELPYGTNPDWFDPSYWYDGVHPRFNLGFAVSRLRRNVALTIRYQWNHSEGLALLALLVALGARPWRRRAGAGRSNPFWMPPVALALMTWLIYAAVNVEERYVTFAFLVLLLAIFATLRHTPADDIAVRKHTPEYPGLLALLLALVAASTSLRLALEDRHYIALDHLPGGWYSVSMHQIADALVQLGVHPGDSVACAGTSACIGQFYWARLDGARILTEISAPRVFAYPFLRDMTNRDQVLAILRAQGARVLVVDFESARVSTSDPFFKDWQQLGDTTFYALPLNPAH